MLRIGQPVFEIYNSVDGGLPEIHDQALSGTLMLDIWPTLSDRYWPPPHSFDDTAFMKFNAINASDLPSISGD